MGRRLPAEPRGRRRPASRTVQSIQAGMLSGLWANVPFVSSSLEDLGKRCMCVHLCAFVCISVCVCACVHACMCVCVNEGGG